MKFLGKEMDAASIEAYCDAEGKRLVETDAFFTAQSDDFRARMSLAGEVGCLHYFIRELASEVNSLKDRTSAPKPYRGHEIYNFNAEGGTWVVHYEYFAGEEPSDDSPGDFPGVRVAGVYVNGMDILDDLPRSLVDRIEEECLCFQEISIKNGL